MATDADTYRILGDIQRSLGTVEGRLGAIEGRLDSTAQLEPRVARLERYKAWILGVVAGVGTLVGVVASFFKD